MSPATTTDTPASASTSGSTRSGRRTRRAYLERFRETLPGKSLLANHRHAEFALGRFYKAEIEEEDGVLYLVPSFYMVRSPENEEARLAQKKKSHKKGKWEKKLAKVQTTLETFTGEVKPGNQTALGTRAHPFAIYIARMHRRIHELWGFGFLEDLDNKSADYPLNDPNLWVNLELSVNPDGTLHKVTIAKTSGKTEFDVAAVDTVISSAPFEATPEAIRSVDGRIYLRWGFYRNWRQCGTFNVEPSADLAELVVPEREAAAERVPLQLALVVDRSGSMAGPKLAYAKRCASWLAGRLRPADRLALVDYDDRVRLLAPLAPVDHAALARAIDSIHARGSTNLSGGWLKGFEELQRGDAAAVRKVLLLTDGLANQGITDPATLGSPPARAVTASARRRSASARASTRTC